jgi:UDP-N-acetylmuramoyl-tripeptide--D-alanyl-D-alanine ligase
MLNEIASSVAFNGVSVDSRLHKPGNLFFALQGEKTDGHHYLADIAAKGALAAVVHYNYTGPNHGLTLVRVQDPLLSLQNLAAHRIQKSKSRIIAITGSVGKTTTKDFITTLLKEKFTVASSPGNSNSQIGLPLTICNHTTGNEEIVVLEMGMTHPGNISQLIAIAPPECAVITTVALVHACNFESVEEIARTKAEILLHPKTKMAIIHRDISNYSELEQMGSCLKKSFSYDHPLADYIINLKELDFSSFPIEGKHYQTNFLAAVACARYFGLSFEEIASGMRKLKLPELRGQQIEKGEILFINDAYNAAPISVKAALQNIPSPKNGGRKIAVLADMLELGKFSESSHREVGQVALNFVDLMFCYGAECRHLLDCWQNAGRPVHWFSSRQEAVHALKKNLRAGDVVLVKGSRSTQISKIVDELGL